MTDSNSARGTCACCGFRTLQGPYEDGSFDEVCPLCDYEAGSMSADLDARRERFKRTLTVLDPEEVKQWGGRPFTPEQLELKRTLLECYRSMAMADGDDDLPRWLEVRSFEHQLKLLEEAAEDAAVAKATDDPGDEASDDPDEDAGDELDDEAGEYDSDPSTRRPGPSLGKADVVAFVPTRDPKRARAFYEETLGLQFVYEDSFAVVFNANGIILRVVDVSQVKEYAPMPFTILGWHVPSTADAVRALAAKGVSFERYPGMDQSKEGIWKSPGGALVAWFKDPDGNVLSVTQY